MGRYFFLLLSLLWGLAHTHGQVQDSLSYAEQFALLEAELDTIGMFDLVTDLLALDESKSEGSVRMFYSSSVVSAGRDFSVRQQGLAPGLTYFHKSGWYLDASTYMETQVDPLINETLLHTGYLFAPSPSLTVNPYIERSFSHSDSVELTLPNAIGTQINYDFGLAEVGSDYAFLWGDDTGHRWLLTLSRRVDWQRPPFFKKWTLQPAFSASIGTAAVYYQRYSGAQLSAYTAELLQLSELTDEDIASQNLTVREEARLRYARAWANRLIDSDRGIDAILRDLNPLQESKAFSLLSYNVSLPLFLQITDNLSASISYSYSFPMPLPGEEEIQLDPIGYFGLSVSQRLRF